MTVRYTFPFENGSARDGYLFFQVVDGVLELESAPGADFLALIEKNGGVLDEAPAESGSERAEDVFEALPAPPEELEEVSDGGNGS